MKTSRMGILAALVLGSSCNDFESPEVVRDLRILTIAADTPELILPAVPTIEPDDLEGTSSEELERIVREEGLYRFLGPPPPIRLRALVVDPRDPTRPVRFRAEACFASGFVGCGPSSATADDDGEGSSERESASRVVVVQEEVEALPGAVELVFAPSLEDLEAWKLEDAFKGFSSLYVQVDLTVVAADGTSDRAAKIVTYTPPLIVAAEGQEPPPPRNPNRNPVLTAVQFDDEARTEAEGPPSNLVAGRKVKLEPLFDADATLETYPVQNFPTEDTINAGYTVLTEKLSFDFFTVKGKLSPAGTTTLTPAGDVEDYSSDYTPPKAAASLTDTVWIVVRDDRGGISWTTWQVTPTN
jgi:hypothetical protein